MTDLIRGIVWWAVILPLFWGLGRIYFVPRLVVFQPKP